MDNNKRGIGDNSTEGKFTSIFEKEAVSEMMRDMKGFAKEAEQLIYKLSDALKKVTTGKDSLTDKQENWNLNVDKYNDWIMEQIQKLIKKDSVQNINLQNFQEMKSLICIHLCQMILMS